MTNTDSTRKLWVLQGKADTLPTQLRDIVTHNKGDWITVTPQLDLPTCFANPILPNKAKSLLGQEYRHAIFDATQGFNLDAFAILTGTLVKGSVLILLLPEQLDLWQDHDSLRWNENDKPIHTPNFIKHLLTILKDFEINIWGAGLCPAISPAIFCRQQLAENGSVIDSNLDLQEQQKTLQQLLQSNKPIMALIAKRGRGKSALAGLFTHYRNCIVTAPNKDSLGTFFRFTTTSSKSETSFYAPDELLTVNLPYSPDYLIIDEAAMIPLPMLEQLLQLTSQLNCRILLTTTVDGYEGTGQGFLLKLLQNRDVDFFYLNTPIRWDIDDELERFTDRLLINNSISIDKVEQNYEPIDYSLALRDDFDALIPIYHLLKIAHYRTTPVDLRRLLDAQNLLISQAKQNEKLVGALVSIYEGGLPELLIDEVWKGTRRPKGNLVAQSLVAHAGEKLAANLLSLRVNRIAVEKSYRRQNIAKSLIQNQLEYANKQGKDFLSVSFAYSDEISRFWQACGFVLVHVASHKEASSGSYSVMAINPITEQGKQLTQILQKKLQRNWCWLKNIIELDLDIETDPDQTLSLQDCEELRGFANYHRPYEATYASLCRLVMRCDNCNQPILTALITQKKAESRIISEYQLTGRQALMQSLKQEVIQLLDGFC